MISAEGRASASGITQFHLHSKPSTRTISAEGRARKCTNAISFAFRAFDTHDLREELTFVVVCRDVTRCDKMSDVRRWSEKISDVRSYGKISDVKRCRKISDVSWCEKIWENVRCEKMMSDVRRCEKISDIGSSFICIDLFTPPSFWRTLRSDALEKKWIRGGVGSGGRGNYIFLGISTKPQNKVK